MVQFQSRQAQFDSLAGDEMKDVEELAHTDPEFFKTVTMSRFSKDPANTVHRHTAWNDMKNMPYNQLKAVMRPKILQMDERGCLAIKQKIEAESEIEELEQIWLQENHTKT